MIKRTLSNGLKSHLSSREISLIIGPRQAGKTTLMNILKEDLDKNGEITLYFNLDYEQDNQFFASQDIFIRKLDLELDRKRGIVFIDEIQRKENAGLFLKGIYDLNLPYKFVASGSGSLELKEKIHESLAGRKRLFELNTVSLLEYLNYMTGYKYENKFDDFFSIEKDRIRQLLLDYLNYGGYPRVVIETEVKEKIKIIDEIYKSYLEKDIVYLLKVDRSDAFVSLLKLLSSQVGGLVKYSELSSSAGISVPTIKNYINYAEKTFVLNLLPPYFKNIRKEITKSPVAYFNDLGLRNYCLGIFGNITDLRELGFVFQNLIFNTLKEKMCFSGYSLHYWRTLDKAEVDFIVNKGKDILPVESKYSSLKKPEITRPMHNFIEKYKPGEAWVINIDYKDEIKINDTRVLFVPFYELIVKDNL